MSRRPAWIFRPVACVRVAAVAAAALASTLAYGPIKVGNGGDAIVCRADASNDLTGTLALDYVLTRNADAAPLVPAATVDASLARLSRLIGAKLPEYAPLFAEFVRTLRNTDQSQPRWWEPAPYGLTRLDDQNIIAAIPDNCRAGNDAEIVQAVIRLDRGFSGARPDKIVYSYVPQVYDALAASDPVQLSFLLVHEFLWDLSDIVDRNRRINRFLHSRDFDDLPMADVRERLRGMGLTLPLVPTPVVQGPSQLAVHGMACLLRSGHLRCDGDQIRPAAVDFQGWLASLKAPDGFALGYSHLCTWRVGPLGARPQCVGDSDPERDGATRLPLLTNIKAMAAGPDYTCVLSDEGTTCAGDGPKHLDSVPDAARHKATAIAGGVVDACLIADSRAFCFGPHLDAAPDAGSPHPDVRPERDWLGVTAIRVGGRVVCAMVQGEIRCEGLRGRVYPTPPEATGATRFSVGDLDRVCALVGTRVGCWTIDAAAGTVSGVTWGPPLVEPVDVVADSLQICALERRGVLCWGSVLDPSPHVIDVLTRS